MNNEPEEGTEERDDEPKRKGTGEGIDIAKYAGKGVVPLIRDMAALDAERGRLKGLLSAVNEEYDYVRLNRLPAQFEVEGIDLIGVAGVGKVHLKGDAHVGILKEDREKVYQALRDLGKGSLITETVHAGTLKAVVNEMLDRGEQPPDGISVSPYTKAVIVPVTKAKVRK